MTQATLSVRIDKDDKKKFESFCKKTGMNITTAINMYIKNVINNGALPFPVALPDPFYSHENQAHLRQAIQRVEKTGGTEHELIEEKNEK